MTGEHQSRRSPWDDPDLQILTRELPQLEQDRTAGSVRWFNPEKGYGFIQPDDGGEDVFVRFSSLQGDGFRSLESGQRVAFSRTTDARGPRAVEVEVLAGS